MTRRSVALSLFCLLMASVVLAPLPARSQSPDEFPVMPTFVGENPALNAKEEAGAELAAHWRNKPDKPIMARDGKLLYRYGTAMPSVVCAPLHVCDIELQPGEQVEDVHVGDTVRWTVSPSRSGPLCFGEEVDGKFRPFTAV